MSESNQRVTDPNDYKVVEFTNTTDFVFTPVLGAMYDGRPIFGRTGAGGIGVGETLQLPYYVGVTLARNLAKAVMVKNAPGDVPGVPTGIVLWDTDKLENLKNSFLKDLYQEERPIAQTETDRLMAKVEEYQRMVEKLLDDKAGQPSAPAPSAPVQTGDASGGNVTPDPVPPTTYADKKDVLAELEKRGVPHDKRKSKAELEKLLA